MIDILILGGIVIVIAALVGLLFWLRKRPRRMHHAYFQKQWREMQKLCSNKETWHQAILQADKLLDEALKKKRYGGKSMGERLVSAQRILTDNDSVWFGHKLRNKLHEDPAHKLKEKDVKQALIGIRQALKDLGALPNPKAEAAEQLAKETAK